MNNTKRVVSHVDHRRISDIFLCISKILKFREVEYVFVLACVNPFFSLATAFQICDLDGNGEITRQEIMRLCQSRGFFISDKDAVSIMDKFDRSRRGAITKNEFVQEMVPKSPNKRLF